MAKNDKVLIDGIIDDRLENKIPSDSIGEVFEYFVFEQLLKEYDLSKDEISYGYTDGRNDGGIDGFYIFINGHLLTEIEKFNWPKSGSVIELWLITCKHHDTFKQFVLESLIASLTELFDFSIDNGGLNGDYSEQLIHQRDNLKQAYRKVSSKLSEFKIYISYATRGNIEELGESVISRAKQIEYIASSSFGNCIPAFSFIGATELIELYRKSPNFTLELPFSDDLSNDQAYIVLVKLSDYYKFIVDNGKLRRYLFDSNVRDYMGLNRVNDDIKNTLLNDDSPDFWWLNNGITILATGASVIGKSIQIQDIQIVNGLQTSESIYRYFNGGGIDKNNRSVLVKIIVINNLECRDEIIRATNNQTVVELSALHATDKIQRDIEDVLKLNDFYYERRTNFYKNQGIKLEQILTPMYLAAGYVSLILKAPEQAMFLKSKFMRNENTYSKIFSQTIDIQVWPKIAYVLKETDKFVEARRPRCGNSSEHFLKTRRHLLSFIALSIIFKKYDFTVKDLIRFEFAEYNKNILEKSWNIMVDFVPMESKCRIKRKLLIKLCAQLDESEGVAGFERLLNKYGIDEQNCNYSEQIQNKKILDDFAEKVDLLLPKQPWKPGISKVLSIQLECSERDINRAIKKLISSGKRYKQKDGIIYDRYGKIIGVDAERVDVEVLKLLE